jgi:phage shock protein PspC (stress-responsive transcriptional regulator)
MKRLHRSKTDKKIFGVCGGIGETYDIDPTLLRIVVVFLGLATGLLPMIITYIVARLIMPPADR